MSFDDLRSQFEEMTLLWLVVANDSNIEAAATAAGLRLDRIEASDVPARVASVRGIRFLCETGHGEYVGPVGAYAHRHIWNRNWFVRQLTKKHPKCSDERILRVVDERAEKAKAEDRAILARMEAQVEPYLVFSREAARTSEVTFLLQLGRSREDSVNSRQQNSGVTLSRTRIQVGELQAWHFLELEPFCVLTIA